MAKRVKKIGSAEDRIASKYGDVFIPASSLAEKPSRKIPTTLGMDIALNGGIMEGTMVTIGGKPKSGKTTFILRVAANAQKMGKKVYFVDAEHRLQDSLLNCIPGLDKENFTIIRSSQDKILLAEEMLNIIIDILTNEEDVFLVLDSIAALCPENTFTSSMDDNRKVMGIPTMMYVLYRRLAPVVSINNSNFIALTHVQSSPDPRKPITEYGGNSQQYFGSYLLTCLSSTEVPKDAPKKIGKDSKFKIKACADGPPGEGTIHIRYGKGCDRFVDLVTQAEEFGFLARAGAWYSVIIGDQERVKVQGLENLITHMSENQELANELEEEIRNLVFGRQNEVQIGS